MREVQHRTSAGFLKNLQKKIRKRRKNAGVATYNMMEQKMKNGKNQKKQEKVWNISGKRGRGYLIEDSENKNTGL